MYLQVTKPPETKAKLVNDSLKKFFLLSFVNCATSAGDPAEQAIALYNIPTLYSLERTLGYFIF
jgi:hypothetical protein